MVNRLPVTPQLLTPEQKLERCNSWIAAYHECCLDCDFELNAMVLRWMGLPFDADSYRAHLAENYDA